MSGVETGEALGETKNLVESQTEIGSVEILGPESHPGRNHLENEKKFPLNLVVHLG